MKKSDKKISLPFKISIVSSVLLVLINFSLVFFILLPIYDLAGDNTTSSVEKDKKLDDAELMTNVVVSISTTLIIVSLFSGGYGIYKEINKKDVSKKSVKPTKEIKSVKNAEPNKKKTVKKKK